MYRQILVNVCKKYVIYIVYYITEFCQKLTKGLKKRIKIFYVLYLLCIFPIHIELNYNLIANSEVKNLH